MESAEARARRKEYLKKWYEANKERIRERARAHRQTEEVRSRINAYKRKYRKTEEFKAKRRATRDLSKDRARWKKYYEVKKEQLLATRAEANKRPEVKETLKVNRRRYYLRKGKQRGLDLIKNLNDNYVKLVLVKDTALTFKDIPKEMVEAKRLQILIRRQYIANTTPKQRFQESKRKYKAKQRKLLTKENRDENRN